MLKEVSIEIIRKCPNYCLHCSSSSDEHCKEILEYDCFTSVVSDAAKLGARTICFSGGEPFLHSRIVDMIEFVAALGLQTYIYTAGIIQDDHGQLSSLNREVLRKISKNATKLIFNIEAAKSNTYDVIMGTTNCFEKMKQSISVARSFSIMTEAHFVPMKLNIEEAIDVVALCKKLGVSRLSFLRLVLHGRALDNEFQIALSDEGLKQFKVVLNELQKNSEIDIRIGVPLAIDSSCHKCEAANGKLNIKYDGNVFPCEVFKNDRISHCLNGTCPESIHNKSLTDIYHNSAYLQLVRKLSQEFSCSSHGESCIGQFLINSSQEGHYE